MALAVLAAGCAGSEAVPVGPTDSTTTTTIRTATTATTAASSTQFIGGDRPARLVLPPSWEADGDALPLVVLLHGYSASGELQDIYLGLSSTGADLGYLTVTPNGTEDPFGNQFWNVSTRFDAVDDVSYVNGLIDEAVADYNADPARVYLVGHSNGGFMANKLACETPERIAGIAAIAGGLVVTETACAQPMRVFFIQGTDDGTVPYEGGSLLGVEVLGAEETVQRWREVGQCASTSVEEAPVDFDLLVAGAESTITRWEDCVPSVSVELWRMEGSGHVPGFRRDFAAALMSRMLNQEDT